jgi:hypothetical protein
MSAVTSHPGRLFAAAATLVTAPRLVLAFLTGDGIAVPEGIRIALLSTSSVATAVAMTGGAAYLAHAIAVARRGRGVLTALWIAVLAFSSALMAPVLAAGLPRSALAAVLPSSAQQWAWAVCAVLAIDLVAAGAIRADAEQQRDRQDLADAHRREIAELLAQRDSARAALLTPTAPGRPASATAPQRRSPGAAPQLHPSSDPPGRSATSAPERRASAAADPPRSAAPEPASPPERPGSAGVERFASAGFERPDSTATERPDSTEMERPDSAATERWRSATAGRSPATADERQASAAVALSCSCGYTAQSQQALAGHLRWCQAARSATDAGALAAAPASLPTSPGEPAPPALT